MRAPVILASGSAIRAKMLDAAGVRYDVVPASIDEAGLRDAMAAEGLNARDQADALAEAKARKVSGRHPAPFVLGSDQVLVLDGDVLSKPKDHQETRTQLRHLSGKTHQLLSAAVIVQGGAPIWRIIGTYEVTMRALTDAQIDAYLARNGRSVIGSLGGYKLEEQGLRLFSQVRGDYFTGLGLPIHAVLAYLVDRGVLEP